jgi:FMN reductase
MRILVISGSPREQSYTRVLTRIAYDYAKKKHKDHEVILLDLKEIKLEGFRGLEERYYKITEDTIKLIENTDVFIIGSPVYNGIFSSLLKNLFEFVNYKALEGSFAGFIIMSGGLISYLQVQGQLTALMNYFRVISNPRAVYVSTDDFDDKMELKDEKIKNRIERLVDETSGFKKV